MEITENIKLTKQELAELLEDFKNQNVSTEIFFKMKGIF